MALHVDTRARPVAAHKPAPVPLHWQREVKECLDNDVAMGVLEKEPFFVLLFISKNICYKGSV